MRFVVVLILLDKMAMSRSRPLLCHNIISLDIVGPYQATKLANETFLRFPKG
jgi:hypothetical protein